MRNLKKFLALVLALMMAVSVMVTVSAADVTDTSEVTAGYQTAVDVLKGLGVIKGDENGQYDPAGTITRAEFATMLYRIGTGDAADDGLKNYAEFCNFSDVPAGNWAAGGIGYAQANGYMVGTGSGKFSPAATITGHEVLLALLRLIGYDAADEITNAAYWQIATMQQAKKIELYKGVPTSQDWGKPATRETIAQLMFTTLTTEQTVTLSGATGAYLQNNPVAAGDAGKTVGAVNFGLTSTEKKDTTDKFGRPGGNVWEYGLGEKKETIAETAPETVKTYTGTVTEATVTADLKDYKVNGKSGAPRAFDYEATSGNGFEGQNILHQDSAKGSAFTATGKKTAAAVVAGLSHNNTTIELYDTDGDKVIDNVVVVSSKAGKVVKGGTTAKPTYSVDSMTIDTEKYTVAENDVVVYTQADKAIQSVTVIPGVVATMGSYNATAKTYVIGGETYSLSAGSISGVTDSVLQSYLDAAKTYYFDGDLIVYVDKAPEAPEVDSNYVLVLAYEAIKGEGGSDGTGLLGTGGKDAQDAIAVAQVLDLATGKVSVVDVAVGQDADGDWFYLTADGKVGTTPVETAKYDANSDLDKNLDTSKYLGFRTYVELDDGSYVFTGQEADEIGSTDRGAFAVTKGSAKVTVASNSYKYATANTVLTVVTMTAVDGKTTYSAQSYSGYRNFVDVKDAKAVNIVYDKTNTDTPNEIYVVVGGEAPAKETKGSDRALYLGTGNTTKDGTEYKFLVDGKEETYIGSKDLKVDNAAPVAGVVYQITFAAASGEISKLEKNEGTSVTLTEFQKGEYIVGDDDAVYYLAADCVIYDVKDGKGLDAELKGTEKVTIFQRGGSDSATKDEVVLIVIPAEAE